MTLSSVFCLGAILVAVLLQQGTQVSGTYGSSYRSSRYGSSGYVSRPRSGYHSGSRSTYGYQPRRHGTGHLQRSGYQSGYQARRHDSHRKRAGYQPRRHTSRNIGYFKHDPTYLVPKCAAKPDQGRCYGYRYQYEVRYYYHVLEGKCMPFWYSGCGGNQNRFIYKELCKDTCVIKVTTTTATPSTTTTTPTTTTTTPTTTTTTPTTTTTTPTTTTTTPTTTTTTPTTTTTTPTTTTTTPTTTTTTPTTTTTTPTTTTTTPTTTTTTPTTTTTTPTTTTTTPTTTTTTPTTTTTTPTTTTTTLTTTTTTPTTTTTTPTTTTTTLTTTTTTPTTTTTTPTTITTTTGEPPVCRNGRPPVNTFLCVFNTTACADSDPLSGCDTSQDPVGYCCQLLCPFGNPVGLCEANQTDCADTGSCTPDVVDLPVCCVPNF